MIIIKRGKYFFLLFFSFLLMQSCSKKHFICAAYNSYFIHDETERESRFSLFIVDSLTSVNSIYNDDYDNKKNKPSDPSVSQDSLYDPSVSGSNSKYQPKETVLKKLPNGLLAATSNKKSTRPTGNVEMKIIMVKPLSRYSNIDSSSIRKDAALDAQEAPADTL